MIAVSCDCGWTGNAKDADAGRAFRCPSCKSSVVVPVSLPKAPRPDPAPSPPAAATSAPAPRPPSRVVATCTCGRTSTLDAKFAGKGFTCAGCGRTVTVPIPGSESATPAATEFLADIKVGLTPLERGLIARLDRLVALQELLSYRLGCLLAIMVIPIVLSGLCVVLFLLNPQTRR